VSADRVAAIDCGTNSIRLLIGERAGPAGPADTAVRRGNGTASFTIVERLMRITRLGERVDRTGVLAPAAIDRTTGVLREYREVMDRHGVGRVRVTATSAARDAANREVFFDAAADVIGTRPELLTGDEEGRLSFRGATAELDQADGPFLVVDIGGGSTEFVVGHEDVDGVQSVDIGCVRLTEQFLLHDPPQAEELSACLAVTDAYLDDVARELPTAADARTFLGLAGTVTTVAAVEIGLATYDRDRLHHFRLTHAAAEDVFRTLATEARAARVHNPGLEEDRADVIVAGCCILVAVFRHFGFEECLVSEADILDGLVLSLL
jgi:exopolyphosphatase / guanosine-5'-triphosphate,3'-diphosphate pyrophosphatase